MKRFGLGTVALFGLAVLAVGARADEEKIPLDRVPAAVLKTVKDRFPKAEIKQAEKETEGGKTVYEIGLKDGGQNIDVAVTADGKIVEIEREIAERDLPRAVVDSVKAKYPNGTFKKAEEVTKGKTKSFEVHLKDGNKSREVVLDPSGKILKKEEDDEG